MNRLGTVMQMRTLQTAMLVVVLVGRFGSASSAHAAERPIQGGAKSEHGPAQYTHERALVDYAYLKDKTVNPNESDQIMRAAKEAAMARLDESEEPASQLAQVYIEIYRDHTFDVAVRDYAIQHLRVVYEKTGDVEDRAAIEKVLWLATADTDSSIAGTSLLTLVYLVKAHPEMDQSRLGDVALRILRDTKASDLSLITAIQICGKLGLRNAAETLGQFVNKPYSVAMRISAVGALGQLGDEQRVKLAVNDENPQVQFAAKAALKRMEDVERSGGSPKDLKEGN